LAQHSRSPIKLEPAVLNSYAGEYRYGKRLSVKIAAVEDHLETMWLGQKLIMSPESKTLFFEEDSKRKLRFITARGGRVTAAIISVPEELTLQRLP